MIPHRATAFFYIRPAWFLSHDSDVVRLDIESWSQNEYEWEEDELGGYMDFVSRPYETVASSSGDCEDYAAVAASWEVARGRDVEILFLYNQFPFFSHAVAAANNRIYDSGRIWHETTPDEYLDETSYTGYVSRKV